MQAQNSYEMSV